MEGDFGGDYCEPSPEKIREFSELVEREALRKRWLEERKESVAPPTAASTAHHRGTPWQPRFVPEDFKPWRSPTGAVGAGCPPKPAAGKASSAAGTWSSTGVSAPKTEGAWRYTVKIGTKRRRDQPTTAAVTGVGEDEAMAIPHNREKTAAATAAIATMQTKIWDLNKGFDSSDDSD